MRRLHNVSRQGIGYPNGYAQLYVTLQYCSAFRKNYKTMKSLDFSAMENIHGGALTGTIGINLPISSLISALGLGSLLGVALGLGVGVSYDLTGVSLPSLSSL
jgi:hypothetical protein